MPRRRSPPELFGWDYEDFPTGEGAGYSIAQLDGRPVAAIVPLPDPSIAAALELLRERRGRRCGRRARGGAGRDGGAARRRRG
jgi:antitoxin (DNA-binding transcriptional repressor) of toxin-antitoxin stability system